MLICINVTIRSILLFYCVESVLYHHNMIFLFPACNFHSVSNMHMTLYIIIIASQHKNCCQNGLCIFRKLCHSCGNFHSLLETCMQVSMSFLWQILDGSICALLLCEMRPVAYFEKNKTTHVFKQQICMLHPQSTTTCIADQQYIESKAFVVKGV